MDWDGARPPFELELAVRGARIEEEEETERWIVREGGGLSRL